MSVPQVERCSEASLQAGEPLAGTASVTQHWLLVEVPGPWSRDVSAGAALPERAREAVRRWLDATPRSRLLFLRRPGALRAGLAVFTGETGGRLRRHAIGSHEELAEIDLAEAGTPVTGQLVLVCGHGARDACCALRGTPVFGALEHQLHEDALWISSHQGGHRFAANVVLLPAGIQLGRLDPDSAPSVVAAALEGRLELAHYRGRTSYDPPVQAAEHAVREATGLLGLDELRLESNDARRVRFRDVHGHAHEVLVRQRQGPMLPVSCGAQPERQQVFDAAILGRVRSRP